jgi:type II secretory pathway component HofQ
LKRSVKPLVALVLFLAAFPSLAAERERTVTLDVKDAEAREILQTMQTQCGIKNLVIDPDVQGSGSFFFREVPCRQAFKVVLRTMGLRMTTYSETMVTVEPQGR